MCSTKIITFEGIDGSGKSTICEELNKYLLSKAKSTLSLREPGCTELGEKIRKILQVLPNISRTSEMLLFLTSRAQMVEDKIIPALGKVDYILIDRYIHSTEAYQPTSPRKLVEDLNKFVTREIFPDKTFYIEIPYETMLSRLENQDVIESRGQKYYEEVMWNYDELCRANPWVMKKIDGTKKPCDLLEDIKKEL